MLLRHALSCVILVGASATLRLAPAPTPVSAKPTAVVKAATETIDRTRKGTASPGDAAHTVAYAATAWNVHTHQLLPVEGEVVDGPELRRFLRCRVTGQSRDMQLRPMEVAVEMAQRFGQDRIEVVSGYRSSKFNEILRKKGHQVAERSQHVTGSALDFRIPGVRAAELARAVEEVHAGGIGTYARSGFVHVDVGRDRRWRGQ